MFLFLTLQTPQMFQNISVLKWPLAHFHFNAFFQPAIDFLFSFIAVSALAAW